MAAIITDDFRKNNIENFIADVAKVPTPLWTSTATFAAGDLAKHNGLLYRSKNDSNTGNNPNDGTPDTTNWEVSTTEDTGGTDYYVGIGKTDPWLANANGTVESDAAFIVPNPTGSILEKADVKKNLITLVKIGATDCLRLAPQVPFETGRIYKVFDPTDPTCFDADASQNTFPCYAMTQDAEGNRKIYMCLGNNNNGIASQSIPDLLPRTENYPYGVEQNSTDKYIWAYVDFFDKTTSNLFSDSLTFFNITPDGNIDGRMNSVAGHGAGTATSGTYNDGRKRAAQASAGLLYGFKINPGQKGVAYSASRNTQNNTGLTARLVGKRLVDADGDTVGDEFDVEYTNFVNTNADGEIESIDWDLTKAKALGYGIATVPKSNPLANGNHTSATVTNSGGIFEATLIIEDSASTGSTFVEADVQPLIAPQYGFGWSPLDDLPSYFCGVSADFKGTVGDDGDAATDGSVPQYISESLVDVDIRQVSLLRNTDGDMSLGEDDLNSSGEYPDPDLDKDKAMNCLQFIQVAASSVPGSLNNLASGSYLVMNNGGAGATPMAWVDKVSKYEANDPASSDGSGSGASGGYRIYYHQNSDKRINQLPLVKGRTFEVFNNLGTSVQSALTAANIVQGEYKQNSGEVMFVDNRTPIRRNKQQTEEVRLIIQF